MKPNTQRIGIIVIAVVMVVGTLGSFAMMILANENQQTEQERQTQELQRQYEEQQKVAKELSDTYYADFKVYEDRPAEFDAEAVGSSVTHVDLKKGDGEKINDDSVYRAYYIGWNPEGVMFDSSFSGESLKSPLPISAGAVIPGWYDGVEGMRIGGVREITIPSDLAYGEKGSGDDIPPNTPLKFIVMAIPASE